MLDLFAMQDIGWRRRTGIKDNGAAIYSPAAPEDPTVIKGRVESSRRLVRNEKGEQVISQAYVMTTALIELGDMVVWQGREWPVLTVDIETDLMGKELHREIYF